MNAAENELSRKEHWENVYQNKALTEVSWYQAVPQSSLDLIFEFASDKNAALIDVGGGDSFLTDYLLAKGYTDHSVLDISYSAIERAKLRLNEFAGRVNWICSDISTFMPERKYRLWHDRAAFHFLNSAEEIKGYLDALREGLEPGGVAIVATFSDQGPLKCSGIEIKQYTEESMTKVFQDILRPIRFNRSIHPTPFQTEQEFLFGVFERI